MVGDGKKYEGIDAIEVRMNRTYNTLLKYKMQMNFPMDKVNHRWQAYEKDIKKWEEFQENEVFFEDSDRPVKKTRRKNTKKVAQE